MNQKDSKGILNAYTQWLSKYYKTVTLFSLVLAIGGFYYSVLLYKNLRTDMEELLPETAQSVKDVKRVVGRVGGLNHISVVVETADVEAGRRFQKDVAEKLAALPKNLVARVKYNILDEQEFFKSNKALYMDLGDWEALEDYVRDRIRFEKRKSKAFNLGLDDDNAVPAFDFSGLKTKYETRAAGVARFKDGLFESRDGRTHVVLAFLPGKVTDMAANDKLSKIAHDIVDSLSPKKYAADMVVGFSGDVQNLVEEHHGLIEDLILSFVVCTILVAAVLILFYRSFWIVYALCSALFAGTAWTFGASYFIVGYLNANTAFLGSIVIGNGINFGIIMAARYLEERKRGLQLDEALPISIAFTARATAAAAAAAGLSYLSLMITDFRGFNQFGIIGGVGMALCWISTFTLFPAMLIWIERMGFLKIRQQESSNFLAVQFTKVVLKGHKPIVLASIAFTIVASIYTLKVLTPDTLESDFSKLRNDFSMNHGAGMWGKKVDAVFERYLTPTIVLTQNSADSEKVADALIELKERDGDTSTISEVKRVEDFLPQDQGRKIKVIERIKELLPLKVRARLKPEERKLVDDLLPVHVLKQLDVTDLPEGILANFREQTGVVGTMVHVYPKLAGPVKHEGKEEGFWDGRDIIRFAQNIRLAVSVAGVGAAIAGQPPLSADMISAIATDGPKATLGAFIAVMLLVIVLFPKFSLSKSILGALLLGVLWMSGVMGIFGLKINFLNFIALPITFGIGVDYAVNIVSRFKSDGGKSIARALENTGGAVVLCSVTTIIGYSSLLLAGSQAFVSFGRLAVLGEFTCLTAAVVSLPAIWYWADQAREKRYSKREMSQPSADLPSGKG